MVGPAATEHSGWLRAAGLTAAAVIPWVGSPFVLIGVPFGLLVLFMPARRPLALALAAAALGLMALGDSSSAFWYLERGWALLLGGWFLALSIRWPDKRFLARGLGAVLGASIGMVLFFRVRPSDWSVVEWVVRSRMELGMSAVLQAARVRMGSGAVTRELEAQALEAVALQTMVFPALLCLASLAALGLAWWLFTRMARREPGGIGPLREFRFSDQLVWVLILGAVAVAATSGGPERLGINILVFMGALYALRGAGVVLALTGGFSFLGTVALVAAFILMAPFVVLGAVFMGLGDTWFDLRNRSATPGTGD